MQPCPGYFVATGSLCRCAECRHARFNPGPPSNPRRLNFYGHYRRGVQAKRFRVNQAHVEALRDDAARGAR